MAVVHTRATGIVALVLLTGTMVLGVLTSVRLGTGRWPRFTFQDLHRRVSLVAMVFVALHVVTTVTDSFAPIGWVSVVVPFTSSYRRLWLGLGTIAVDLLLAVMISSLLRRRINPRTWRALHWLAYASWPLAVVHGLGTGTDPHLGWVLALVVGCAVTVLCALAWRLVTGWPTHAATRLAVGATSVVAIAVLAEWTITGPLRPGWAARAGTPAALVGTSKHAATPPTTTASLIGRLGDSIFATALDDISRPALSRHAVGADLSPELVEHVRTTRDQGHDLGVSRGRSRHRDDRCTGSVGGAAIATEPGKFRASQYSFSVPGADREPRWLAHSARTSR